MTAHPVTERIVIDGVFDEAAWALAEPASDFVQQWPDPGAPASERTEVRILYDRENLYIAALCHDSAGPAGIVVNDQRRDFDFNVNDVFTIVIDTFHDHRNGFMFITNPVGARVDGQAGEGYFNPDWDAVWLNESRITEVGWQAEIAIPFMALRFRPGEHAWGVNFLRRVRRKNEDSYWSPVPRPYRSNRVSLAGTLDGIRNVRQGRNLRLKPYATATLSDGGAVRRDLDPQAGVDLKYGLRSQMTLDLSLRTDFSQVEADLQQVNLTRFSLFFPEKREFFLENASMFQFGGAPTRTSDLIPFFTRRIGLQEGRIVPILAGARLSGRAGAYTTGLLSIQTERFGTTPSTNFSVARVRRDLFRRSDVGGIFVSKTDGTRNNRTYGADFNLGVGDAFDVSSYVLLSETSGTGADQRDGAGQVRLAWRNQLVDASAGVLAIGRNFDPQVGFVPRRGIRKSSGTFALTPRGGPRMPAVREFRPAVDVEYITDPDGALETRVVDPSFTVLFQKGSQITAGREARFERLVEPFAIRPSQRIAPGDYRFDSYYVTYSSDRSRTLSGSLSSSTGAFYDGDRDSYGVGVSLQPGYQFHAELTWSRNDVRLASGDFTTDLVALRLAHTFSTTVVLNGLLQYNTDTGERSTNVRFNVIYKPLSDIYVVFNERRSSSGTLLDRAVIAKLTYLVSF
jgi:hypothetical protein